MLPVSKSENMPDAVSGKGTLWLRIDHPCGARGSRSPFPCSLFPVPCYLFPFPCSLLPCPLSFSLKVIYKPCKTMYNDITVNLEVHT